MLRDAFMATDLRTFLEIYARPSSGTLADRDSYEFKYTTAALLIACSRADQQQDIEEDQTIAGILRETFHLSDATLDSLIRMGGSVTDDDLAALADAVNDYFQPADKAYLLESLWRVADADGTIHRHEAQFIQRVATLTNMSEREITDARERAKKEPPDSQQ